MLRAITLILLAALFEPCLRAADLKPYPTEPFEFLFVLDASSGMKRMAPSARTAVASLIANGAQGRMRRGDIFTVWLFQDTVITNAFQPERWLPEIAVAQAATVQKTLERVKSTGKSNQDGAVAAVVDRARQRRRMTIFLISSGVEVLYGTPFDLPVSTIYVEHGKEMASQKRPFITTLVAGDGEIRAWSVDAAGGPVRIPTLPEDNPHPKPEASVPAASETVPEPKKIVKIDVPAPVPQQRKTETPPAKPPPPVTPPITAPKPPPVAPTPVPVPGPKIEPKVVKPPPPAHSPEPVPAKPPPVVTAVSKPVVEAPPSPTPATASPPKPVVKVDLPANPVTNSLALSEPIVAPAIHDGLYDSKPGPVVARQMGENHSAKADPPAPSEVKTNALDVSVLAAPKVKTLQNRDTHVEIGSINRNLTEAPKAVPSPSRVALALAPQPGFSAGGYLAFGLVLLMSAGLLGMLMFRRQRASSGGASLISESFDREQRVQNAARTSARSKKP